MQDRATAFGNRLHALRQARGWSLREAARFLGIAFTRIGEYERGVDGHSGKPLVPPYRQVIRLARVYGVPEAELLALAGYDGALTLPAEEATLVRRYRLLSAEGQAQLQQVLQRLEAREAEAAPYAWPQDDPEDA
ncbi:MAG: helix-turn-helix transcriptional regulator [Candidatus Sericytochromatia bacterium]|nr:helix-turn-helix transcriptional regulator [Candidatus Sericytochromatia bacterium]